jgi:hypothetical protein
VAQLEKLNVVSTQIAQALAAEGLYPREAAAMVKTWQDSWFQEDGVRVLYVLPRAWTDRTLPLTLNPKPSQLVRVMVGRAEVLTPELKNRLSDALVRAEHGDSEARAQAVAEFKNLGRFAPPALQLATAGAGPKVNQTARALLQTAAANAN